MRRYHRSFLALFYFLFCTGFGVAQMPRFGGEKMAESQKAAIRKIPIAQPDTAQKTVIPANPTESEKNSDKQEPQSPSKSEIKIIRPGASQNRGKTSHAAAPDKGFTEIQLKPVPVLSLEGEGAWSELAKNINDMTVLLEKTAKEQNLTVRGLPMMSFIETRQNSYHYEFMLPLADIPKPEPILPEGMRFSLSQAGKAFKFAHKGTYNTIEKTYEAISTFMNSKNIPIKNIYIEEYEAMTDAKSGQPVVVNIYVLSR